MKGFRRKPQRSLRTILTIWFLLFSIVPLAFVTGYSIIKYEGAIDHELNQRLLGNAREINSILSEFQNNLQQKRDRYVNDPKFTYSLATNDVDNLKELGNNWIQSEFATSLTFFNRNGRLLMSSFKDSSGTVREFVPQATGAVYLSQNNLDKLKSANQYSFVEILTNQKMSLILVSKIMGNAGKVSGYLEQLIEIDSKFLEALKNRMKLELIFIRKGGQVIVATHPDFYDYKKDFFASYTQPDSNSYFELTLRNEPHGFIVYPIRWGQTEFYVALGASKGDAISVLRKVNYAFFTVIGAVILVLIVTIIFASKAFLKPLDDLVSATENLQTDDQLVEIPIKSDTEIGLLTESFNEMSRNIVKARKDLRTKVTELENANLELKETQAKLVHSSKMVSLGQLVAGVAHELNNPIGFIHSNMTHLREYTEKLMKLVEVADKNPEQIPQLKKELDIDYIVKDMPKLITSCEDGARRTRDIVLGLRNFSRLEESKIKDIDVHEAIDNTLSLLAGEIKNRVQVHKYYGDLPLISCFASQINQVFMNILSNALQAIEGSGNIWITTKKLTLPTGQSGVSISFQDSGQGMPNDVMEKIFDPFFTTKGVGQGTGLGLSISYGIVQSHGGEIQVKSQPGIGTEFIVILPVKPNLVPT
jgi:two-component system NtrC family sensor kinase